MPRRDDLKTIMVLGSGPIKIGQAAEFDFSGSQAVQALREDGYEAVSYTHLTLPTILLV